MSRDQVFEFQGIDGLTRRGILSLPEGKPGSALLLLPAGLKYRVGPQRLYVNLARELTTAGVAVLRIDPAGMGESDGEPECGPVHELWMSIENGHFVQDAIMAARELKRRTGAEKVYLGGLCGGGITAQLAAAAMPDDIAGIISINIASTLSLPPGRQASPVMATEAKANLRSYLKKASSLDAWKRVALGSSDYRSIYATVAANLNRIATRGRADEAGEEVEGANPLFVRSFRSARKAGLPHLLIFSGNDSRWFQFQDFMLNRELKGALDGPAHRIRVIPKANHDLHWKEWQLQASAFMKDWLAAN